MALEFERLEGLWAMTLTYARENLHPPSLAVRVTLVRTTVCMLVALLLALLQHFEPSALIMVDDATMFTALQGAFAVATVMLTMLIGTRVYSASAHWRRGYATVNELGSAARSLLSSACAFIPFSRKDTDLARNRSKAHFLYDLQRYLVLHAMLAFHDCQNREEPVTVRALLTESEAQELLSTDLLRVGHETWHDAENVVGSTNKLRAGVVELWLRRNIIRAVRKSYFNSEQAKDLNQLVTKLPEIAANLVEVAKRSVPSNLAQYFQVWIAGYVVLYMFVLVPSIEMYTPLWVGFAALILFTADSIVTEMEYPFEDTIRLDSHLQCLQDELQVMLQAHFNSVGYCSELMSADGCPVTLLPIDENRTSSIVSYASTSSTAPPAPLPVAVSSPLRSPDRYRRSRSASANGTCEPVRRMSSSCSEPLPPRTSPNNETAPLLRSHGLNAPEGTIVVSYGVWTPPASDATSKTSSTSSKHDPYIAV